MTRMSVPIACGGAIGALLVGGTRTAHATAYAFSDNQLTNFEVLVSTGSLTINTSNRDTINTANYTGSAGTSFSDPVMIPSRS